VLGQAEHAGRAGRDLLGERAGRPLQVGGRHDVVDQPDARGLGARLVPAPTA